jgi:HEAT repeat protein
MSRKQWTDDKLFDRLLNNRSDKTYWDTVSELRSRANRNIFDRCRELIKSDNPKHRRIGVDIAAQLGISPRPFYKESIALFFDILETEKETYVIASLLYAIGHNNDKLTKSQIEKVCSFKDTSDNFIKNSLVFALGGIDNDRAINTLIHLSADKSANVRNWATFGIGTQSEKDTTAIREALWNRINDKHGDTRIEAIVGLASRKDERIVEAIQKELLREDYQGLVFEAITALGNKQFLPILKGQFNKCSTNEDINPEWLNDMKDCIATLESQ